MLQIDDIPDGHRSLAVVPAPGSAGVASQSTVIFRAPFNCYVTAITRIPGSSITGVDTNSRNLNIINTLGDGSGTVELAAIDYANGTDDNGGSPTAMYSPASPGLSVNANGCISVQNQLVGTGMLLPSVTFIVQYRKR